MDDPIFVRELTHDESSRARAAKTGDVLSDGSVLLWRDDMNRMGLDALRSWLAQKVVEDRATVVLATAPAERAPRRLRDEMS